MTKQRLLHIARTMGLCFSPTSNFQDALQQGRYVFDGVNGQRFILETKWSDTEIFTALGTALRAMGRGEKAMEIHDVLSITGPD